MKILKDPLLHFLVLGGALFALFHWTAGDGTADIAQAGEIVITEGRISALSQIFEKTWQRPPTEQELSGLIEEYIREEVYYREALAMGLDRDDTIVRRRLRQKIQFLSEDLLSLGEPTEEELQAFLMGQPERFRVQARFSFQQVYLNANTRGLSANADALTLLAKLRNQEGDASDSGDQLMIRHHFEDETEREIERALGKLFLQSLEGIPLGEWQGPIESGYGLHLVKISERIDGRIPELAEVREAVLREWSAEKRKQLNEAFYESLRSRYKVTIMAPEDMTLQQVSMTENAN